MDWLKLFALLVATAVTNVQVSAEGPKKKIRIHLPQNVKHIHHHKKIYITNHPASSQYAPAYTPSAEGAVAVPTNIALPTVARVVPLNSLETYEESQTRQPGALYDTRGYYGPAPTHYRGQEFDLIPPRETLDSSHLATGVGSVPHKHSTKKVKIVKINETPRGKIIRNTKPKRIVVGGRPQLEGEHPVSVFHEQFYSDVDGSGTIRKLKTPPRVEKIVDGNTEHIHTYTEEHVHKLVFDDGLQSSPVHTLTGLSPLPSQHAFVPIRHPQTLLAFSPDSLTGYTAVGSLGTPSHLEYDAYNPRDVTHDHIIHDHGEIPPELDVGREPIQSVSKNPYNSQGTRIGGTKNKVKSKYFNKYAKPSDTTLNDYSSFENTYSSSLKPKKRKPEPVDSFENLLSDFRPVPDFNFNFKPKKFKKPKIAVPTFDFDNTKEVTDYLTPQTGFPAPFSVSSVAHNYKPKRPFAGRGSLGFSKFKDPLLNFKDSSYTNNFEFDTSASSSNIVTSEVKNIRKPLTLLAKRNRNKATPSGNIKFSDSDRQTLVNHWKDMDIATIQNDASPSGFEDYNNEQGQSLGTESPTSFILKETSPEHSYYSEMAVKALHENPSAPQSSNDNFQYVEAPTPATISPIPSLTSTIEPPEQSNVDSDIVTEQPKYQVAEIRQRHRNRMIKPDLHINRTRKRLRSLEPSTLSEVSNGAESSIPTVISESRNKYSYVFEPTLTTNNVKYGDKI